MGLVQTINFIAAHPLNQRRKVSALRHWFSWQVGSRLVPGPVAVNFVNDMKLLVSPGMKGATGNIYAGLHEFQDMAFVLHFLGEGELFIDIGSNVGTYTVLASAVGARCIAIEPSPLAFNHLLLNLRLNGIVHKVEARNIAIGSKEGTVRFTEGLDTVNHVVAESETGDLTFSTVAIDTLDEVAAGLTPALIKIDVEGFEAQVIDGATSVLSRESVGAVIIETNGSGRRYGHTDADLVNRMHGFGFVQCTYEPFERKLAVMNDAASCEGNGIFVRDVERARRRLVSAPKFSVGDRRI